MSGQAPATALAGDHETFPQAFMAAARQLADHEAYIEGSRRLTYAQWARDAASLATHLSRLGVVPGSVVIIHLPTSIDYAVCLAAVMLIGGVGSGMNTRLGPRECAAIIERCRPAVVITEDGTELPPASVAFATLRRGELAGALKSPSLARHYDAGCASDPAVIVWTSGTTGNPKGAWYDHANLKAAVRTAGIMSAAFDRRSSTTPFAHAGYMSKIWDQLAYAKTIIILPAPWKAAEALELWQAENITVAACVPTQWAKLLELEEMTPSSLPHVRLGFTATAPASAELIEQIIERLGRPVISRYGMTESPSISGTDPGDPPEVLVHTVGRAQDGIEIRITDDTGASLPAGEVGGIRVRGPCVMRGYWNDPEMTANSLTSDGWLITGDLGYFDPGGNLVLAGRSSDMYIRGGYNVYPLEVENVLLEHPAVAQASVVGLETPVIGEIGVAFVVPADPQAPPSLDDLRGWCRARLADYKAPDRLEIIPQLPLTDILKVDKRALRARLTGK